MKNVKTNKGITLIALVVTIIVLLILAAVTIGLVLGQNGIIGKANQAKSATDIASGKDQVQLALAKVVADKLENGQTTLDIKAEDLQTELQKTDSSASVTGSNPNFTAKYHVNGTEYEYGINTGTQTVTAPEIGSVNKNDEDIISVPNVPKIKTESGMKAVRYNDGTWGEVDTTNANWYSYEPQTGTTENGGTSEWANAMTADESMWVWIPRYAYKITKGNHGEGLTYQVGRIDFANLDYQITEEAGIIDVIFLKGTSNTEYIDKKTGETKTLPNGYIVHPSFTTNIDAGGWSQELEGIWVGKFEASAETIESEQQLAVKPNVASLAGITIGRMWTMAREAKYGLTDVTKSNSLNSHMMKNSEWGAVAYLAHSKYGRNGTEISINNSSSYYTGRSAGTPDSSSTTTSTEGTYEYNTEKGKLASTTGNIYGIYDMSGGRSEYIAAYINNGNSNIDTYGSDFATGDTTRAKSTEFVTVYKANSNDKGELNYNENFGMKGDAIYETSIKSGYSTSWFEDSSTFPVGSSPFFLRGMYSWGVMRYGLFCFDCDFGRGDWISHTDYGDFPMREDRGFRPVIVVI